MKNFSREPFRGSSVSILPASAGDASNSIIDVFIIVELNSIYKRAVLKRRLAEICAVFESEIVF
jgi:hypothetical protein